MVNSLARISMIFMFALVTVLLINERRPLDMLSASDIHDIQVACNVYLLLYILVWFANQITKQEEYEE